MSGLLRRLGLYAVAAWAAVTLDFLLPRLMPGDPAAALFARFQGRLAPEAMAALRATFGLSDAPLWRQYLEHLANLARGELGVSLAYYPAPVRGVVGTGLGWTAFLAGGALVVAGRAADLAEGAAMARRAIDGGAARAKLDALVAMTRGAA